MRSVLPAVDVFTSVEAVRELVESYRTHGFTDFVFVRPAEHRQLGVMQDAATELFPSLRGGLRSYRRQRARTIIHYGPCPLSCQGELRPVPLESGRLVLCCDECDAVFAAPADVMAGRCEHPGLAPDGATWTVFGERMLRDRADDEDLERVGWLHYDWKRRPA